MQKKILLLTLLITLPSFSAQQKSKDEADACVQMPEDIQKIVSDVTTSYIQSSELKRIKDFVGKDPRNIDALTNDGKTLAMIACMHECSDLQTFVFYQSKPGLSIKDKKGWNVLHHAAAQGIYSIFIQILSKHISNSLDIDEPTPDGFTPLDLVDQTWEREGLNFRASTNPLHKRYQLVQQNAHTHKQLKDTQAKEKAAAKK